MYYPRVIINSSQVYRRVLQDLCNKCESMHTRRCNECVVHEPVSGANWLRSMGIHINVLWHGSALPKGLSKFLINRRVRKNNGYDNHPLFVVFSAVMTASTIVLSLRFLL